MLTFYRYVAKLGIRAWVIRGILERGTKARVRNPSVPGKVSPALRVLGMLTS